MGLISKIKKWALKRSLWAFHINTGSCNGCDIEILEILTPRFDAERFGIKLVGSPRHADLLLVTGPITKKSLERVKRVYDQIPDPKFVVVVGTCGSTGGLFSGSYNTLGSVDKLLPVDAYVIGCPVKPEAIIDAVAMLLKKLEEGGGKDGNGRAKK